MTLYQVLYILGAPSVIMVFYAWLKSKFSKAAQDNKALRLGVQALLRAQMINDYNKWSERGYAPIYARENFENCWKEYHALGANGVMDDLHEQFFSLPVNSTEVEKK